MFLIKSKKAKKESIKNKIEDASKHPITCGLMLLFIKITHFVSRKRANQRNIKAKVENVNILCTITRSITSPIDKVLRG